jgi:hypothetical protein
LGFDEHFVVVVVVVVVVVGFEFWGVLVSKNGEGG